MQVRVGNYIDEKVTAGGCTYHGIVVSPGRTVSVDGHRVLFSKNYGSDAGFKPFCVAHPGKNEVFDSDSHPSLDDKRNFPDYLDVVRHTADTNKGERPVVMSVRDLAAAVRYLYTTRDPHITTSTEHKQCRSYKIRCRSTISRGQYSLELMDFDHTIGCSSVTIPLLESPTVGSPFVINLYYLQEFVRILTKRKVRTMLMFLSKQPAHPVHMADYDGDTEVYYCMPILT